MQGEESGRSYFLGAGASKQDGFPLTSELKLGIAAAIRDDRTRFAELGAYLGYLYGVGDDVLREAAAAWRALRTRQEGNGALPRVAPLPDVTDVLSLLDWMIRDQSSFGPGGTPSRDAGASFRGDLPLVRDLIVQALCVSLGEYGSLDAASTTRVFLARVRPGDSLITTNWDLLLDAARDARFGTRPGDYGSTGNVVVRNGTTPAIDERPLLLKLHGSLSWLYCPRCQRLVIDPRSHIAGDRTEQATCECACRFAELIVTPGFVREYRNVHLLNIWREALHELATAHEWIFIGYSLPADDVGIRALLYKARCMRRDLGHPDPEVTVVAARHDRDAVLSRYRSIVAGATAFEGGFGEFAGA